RGWMKLSDHAEMCGNSSIWGLAIKSPLLPVTRMCGNFFIDCNSIFLEIFLPFHSI
uniref:Uncharacterized protein n=1 Tax=Aegilops tauschii subsp. strangulata TaxID=200361 RepID=A0A453DPH9_AEGTS